MVGEKGEQLGIMPLNQAQEVARNRNLDLVEVAPTAAPPITVTTGIYLSNTLPNTRGSLLNPGICIPELWICLATADGPMFVVSIQNLAKRTDPKIITDKYMITLIANCQGA